LALLLFPAVARANMAPPSSGGNSAAEPIGIEGVAVTRETLTIDLRPLAANGLARIEAVYHLYNRGPERKLDLLFNVGSQIESDFQVWIGDQPVPSSPGPDRYYPKSWNDRGGSTPGGPELKRSDWLMYYPTGSTSCVAVTVIVPHSEHELKVRYAAQAAVHYYGWPAVFRQFVYMLAPAREWPRLDVTVLLPEGWHAAWTTDLKREGNTLRGSFDKLPGDSIALTVQAPTGWAYWVLVWLSVVL